MPPVRRMCRHNGDTNFCHFCEMVDASAEIPEAWRPIAAELPQQCFESGYRAGTPMRRTPMCSASGTARGGPPRGSGRAPVARVQGHLEVRSGSREEALRSQAASLAHTCSSLEPALARVSSSTSAPQAFAAPPTTRSGGICQPTAAPSRRHPSQGRAVGPREPASVIGRPQRQDERPSYDRPPRRDPRGDDDDGDGAGIHRVAGRGGRRPTSGWSSSSPPTMTSTASSKPTSGSSPFCRWRPT